MDPERENKNTQKYAENSNQEYDEIDTQTEIYFREQE
jgi:hypothetical protein